MAFHMTHMHGLAWPLTQCDNNQLKMMQTWFALNATPCYIFKFLYMTLYWLFATLTAFRPVDLRCSHHWVSVLQCINSLYILVQIINVHKGLTILPPGVTINKIIKENVIAAPSSIVTYNF